MHVLVVTVVHQPEDARIRYRQVRELLEAGHRVTYVAPFEHCGVTLPKDVPGLRGVSIPRAVGRNRLAALRAARRAVRRHAPGTDIVLMHDPELVFAVTGLTGLPPVVWDVHEDTAATVTLKPWMPRPLRGPAAGTVKLIERFAEWRYHLLLADSGYRPLFRHEHPIVPNTTYVPERVPLPGTDRIVYLGHLTRARGTKEMIEVGRILRGTVQVDLIGHADAAMRPLIEQAQAEGSVVWRGFVRNSAALELVEGALAGLSLLHDEPNYRHSRSTKSVEYMARGVPTISTATPPGPDIADRHRAGFIVPFGDPRAVADAVYKLRDDATLRNDMARSAHAAARAEYAWPTHAKEFIAALQRWAAQDRREPGFVS